MKTASFRERCVFFVFNCLEFCRSCLADIVSLISFRRLYFFLRLPGGPGMNGLCASDFSNLVVAADS